MYWYVLRATVMGQERSSRVINGCWALDVSISIIPYYLPNTPLYEDRLGPFVKNIIR